MALSPTALPFDDIRNLMRSLPDPAVNATKAARARMAEMALPQGSLGGLHELAEWLATWSDNAKPAVTRPLIAVFAATHGIAGGQAEETRAIVETLAAGGAPVSQIAQGIGAGLKVFDLALDLPTPDIRAEAALDEAGCAATIAFGMEAIAGGTDLLCISDIGIGNRLVAGALAMALFGGTASDWVEEGSIEAVEAALMMHGDGLSDPLEALRRVGGREIAAMAGAILAARYQRVPVLLDGFVSCVAASVLFRLDETALDHCLAAHCSSEPWHRRLLDELGKIPLLDLGIEAAGGVGAAMAISIVKNAAEIHTGTASWTQTELARTN
jgi:nicotinate-nucleotide--dimethylbenzimidazole phosphoribosyltransferase